MDVTISYTEFALAPKMIVGQRDTYLNEQVLYTAHLDAETVRQHRKRVITCCVLGMLPLLINPLFVVLICIVVPLVWWKYSQYFKRWQMYVTDRNLCHVDPSFPKGSDFFSIPLADIESVETQQEKRLCGCCCQMPGELLLVTLKADAPRVGLKNQTMHRFASVPSCTYQVKFLSNADYVARVIGQNLTLKV